MLDPVEELRTVLITSKNPRLILSIYSDRSYATPKFMTAVNSATSEMMYKIEKQAIVGLSDTKKLILKGYRYNLFFKRNIRAFETKEEAILFLIDDSTTDKDVPDHLR